MALNDHGLVEGLIFAVNHPIKATEIAELLNMPEEDVKNILGELQEQYAQDTRGFLLTLVGGGYQFRTKPDLKEIMAQFYEKKPPRLTTPMLEVMSIVAYKQPVTRPEIDRIRGVDSTAPLKSLLERGLVEMKGRSETVGNPVLYATTEKFLEWFQIPSLKDLPPLSEVEALNVREELADNLMGLLERDDGFQNEDLRDMDSNLLEIARNQRKLMNEVEGTKADESPLDAVEVST